MGLKSAFKKAGMALGGLLLAGNIGCNSISYPEANIQGLENKVQNEPVKNENLTPKVNAGKAASNFLGSVYVSFLMHEGLHMSVIEQLGHEVRYFALPLLPNPYGRNILGGIVLEGRIADYSDEDLAKIKIAGPIADLSLIETIGYNLRNGKVPENYQSFLATTSLLTRWSLFYGSLRGILNPQDIENDFSHYSMATNTDSRDWFNIVALYTAASIPRIINEAKAAAGIKPFKYTENPRKPALITYPSEAGLNFAVITRF